MENRTKIVVLVILLIVGLLYSIAKSDDTKERILLGVVQGDIIEADAVGSIINIDPPYESEFTKEVSLGARIFSKGNDVFLFFSYGNGKFVIDKSSAFCNGVSTDMQVIENGDETIVVTRIKDFALDENGDILFSYKFITDDGIISKLVLVVSESDISYFMSAVKETRSEIEKNMIKDSI